MTDTIKIIQHGEEQEVELTPAVRRTLEDAGANVYTEDEHELKERVEDLLYGLVTVTPRGASGRSEVYVQDNSKEEASIDHGQPQKIDEADDIVITMIRPDKFTVGWKQ